MDRRHQVFVSSTYTDLIDERREIIQALLEMECLPAGMELLPAADESQWELIRRAIDDSDYYIVIVGGRYGSMGPAGVSYTEQEYDYALSSGMPILGFIHSDPDNLPRPKTELDPDGYKRLGAFRERVKERPVRFYSSAEDLGGKVSRSLSIARTKHPKEGWIRGRHAMTPEQQAEVAELRAELAELRAKNLNKESAIPPDLASGTDTYVIAAVVEYYDKEEKQKPPYLQRYRSLDIDVAATWNNIFSSVGHVLIDESTEAEAKGSISQLTLDLWADRQPLPADWWKLLSTEILDESLSDIIIQLFALGLIRRGSKKRPLADNNRYWALTTLGEDTLLKLRAIQRKPNVEPAGD